MSNLSADIILKTACSQNLIGATDNLQKANNNEIVFYKINSDEKSQKLFKERLAISKAEIIVVNCKVEIENNSKVVLVTSDEHFLECQKQICDKFYPVRDGLKFIAITGTNGKTTTTHLSLVLAKKLQRQALGIGTLGLSNSEGLLESEFSTTTPSYLQLRRAIYKYQDKYDLIFMEISSHALKQERVYKINFDCAAWTNFTQDHLDYHQTMEDYFESKCLLVKKYLKSNAPLFLPTSQSLLFNKIKNAVPEKSAIKQTLILPAGWLKERPAFFQNAYNVENLELAYSLVAFLLGKTQKDFENIHINELSGPEGRFSTILRGDKMIVVDYAHTPDAILNVAESVHKNFQGRPLSILFGCGGNRDKLKRPKMLEAARVYPEKVYVTSDNPRFEDPEQIIKDIVQGTNSKNVIIESDRKTAIHIALREMVENEILLILGKGHEKYQEIKGEKLYFSDFDIVNEYFKTKDSI